MTLEEHAANLARSILTKNAVPYAAARTAYQQERALQDATAQTLAELIAIARSLTEERAGG